MARSNKAHVTSTKEQDQHINGSADDLATAAAEAGEQIQEQVVNVTQQVRQQATDQLMSQKERAADTLDTVALLLHQAGEHAQKEDKALLAGYADKAAGQVGQWSQALREQDVTQLVDETKNLARRQPMLFVGGALAVGFLSARFFRSSAQPPEQSQASASPKDVDRIAGDLPPYDTDQSGFSPNTTIGNMPLDSYTSLQADLTPDAGGILEDYEGAVLEGEEPGAGSAIDSDDATRPEKL